jgi:DNA polymerase-1
MSGQVYLDFEFSKTKEKDLNLVCCSTTVVGPDFHEEKDWWLHQCSLSYEMLKYYLQAHVDKTFFAYSVEAEARSMLSLGIDVLKHKWVDLFIEYRMLKNHNHDLMHGLQLIDGKVKRTFPYGEKGKDNLGAATYKLLKVIIDTEEKDEVRQIIIHGTPEEIEANKERIMRYCRSDITYLPKIRNAIAHYYPKVIPENKLQYLAVEAQRRGNYAARTAKMLEVGYPVNTEWLYNFAGNVPQVLEACQRDINRQFPERPPFRWNKREQRFSLHEAVVKDWIKSKHGDDWEKTDGGGVSLALDAFTKKYTYAHEYPDGHMGAQMVRYLKLKQAMNGFNPNADKNIFHSLGDDGRVRPYFNPYGAQSSRTQPASTSFIFLKPAWQRALVQPRPGKSIGDLDYSSEEFLLSALCSKDRKMLEAYKSGDVYLAFGKMIGWIPQSGTKKSHKFERDVCKSLVLGLSYLMTKYGLAHKLTEDTGKLFTEDEAQELVEQFEETFSDFADWRAELIATYGDEGHIRLPCGWYMFGDNDNFRSVGNVPIQGLGACIMRKAVELAQDAGLTVIFTLHDAIYIEYDTGDYSALDTLKRCMEEAFVFYFEGEMKEAAKMIRVEGNTWGEEFPEARLFQDEEGKWRLETSSIVTPAGMKTTCSKVFIDERAPREFALFSRYMTQGLGEELLA